MIRRGAAALIVAAIALVGCEVADNRDEVAERCAAINRWSFQEGNAISEHPDYDWWKKNCN